MSLEPDIGLEDFIKPSSPSLSLEPTSPSLRLPMPELRHRPRELFKDKVVAVQRKKRRAILQARGYWKPRYSFEYMPPCGSKCRWNEELARDLRDGKIPRRFGVTEDRTQMFFNSLATSLGDDYNLLGVFAGEPGVGKTTSAAACCWLIDPNFWYDKIFVDLDPLVRDLDAEPIDRMRLMDEPEAYLNAEKWQRIDEEIGNFFAASARYSRTGFWFALPVINEIFIRIRRLLKWLIGLKYRCKTDDGRPAYSHGFLFSRPSPWFDENYFREGTVKIPSPQLIEEWTGDDDLTEVMKIYDQNMKKPYVNQIRDEMVEKELKMPEVAARLAVQFFNWCHAQRTVPNFRQLTYWLITTQPKRYQTGDWKYVIKAAMINQKESLRPVWDWKFAEKGPKESEGGRTHKPR